MAIWNRDLNLESLSIHKDGKRTYRLINRSNTDISTAAVTTDPGGLTVSDTIVGQEVRLTVSGGDVGTDYEIKTSITFTDGDIGVYPITVSFWE